MLSTSLKVAQLVSKENDMEEAIKKLIVLRKKSKQQKITAVTH